MTDMFAIQNGISPELAGRIFAALLED